MEEVDSIVIQQLREIGCDLTNDSNEQFVSLKELESHHVMQCVSKCISIITQNESPIFRTITGNMNMANKYKIATLLANSCAELGFKGDIGYQTFLYGNENDIRKLLLFLTERLPKDETPVSAGTVGSDTIANQLKRLSINNIWLPPMVDDVTDNTDDNLWCTYPIVSTFARSLLINKVAPNRRKYYDTALNIPNDIASLIEWNCSQLNRDDGTQLIMKSKNVTVECVGNVISDAIESETDGGSASKMVNSVQMDSVVKSIIQENGDDINNKQKTMEEIRITKEEQMAVVMEQLEDELKSYENEMIHFNNVQDDVKNYETILNNERERLIELEATHKSQSELISEVTTLRSDIESMAQQWQDIEGQLNDQLRHLRMESQSKLNRSAAQRRELNEIKKSITSKMKDLKSKDTMIDELTSKMPNEWPPGRASYTKRILEIVNNVKKQNEETRKVLLETRTLQKEINILSGKLSRTFTVADELIFKDARTNEWNRKCYKLLASMHEHCDQLLSGVGSIGTILREIRQLEESVETERSRKTTSNLTRILADLNQIKLENEQLTKKLNNR